MEARQEQFELARARQEREAVEVRWLMRFQPLQERPGQMEDGGEQVRFLQLVEQRPVDIVHVLAEDMIEVADGLVQVQPDDEAEW